MIFVKNNIMGVMDRSQKCSKNISNSIDSDPIILPAIPIEMKTNRIDKALDQDADQQCETISIASNEMKIKLSFSVDRLLSNETKQKQRIEQLPLSVNHIRSCDAICNNICACCPYPISSFHMDQQSHESHPNHTPTNLLRLYHQNMSVITNVACSPFGKISDGVNQDYKTVVRPTPIRHNDGSCEVPNCTPPYASHPLPASNTASLLRFHQQHQHQMLLTPPTIDQNSSGSIHQYTKVNPNQCFPPKFVGYNFAESTPNIGSAPRLVNAHQTSSHPLKLTLSMGPNENVSNVAISPNSTPNNLSTSNNTNNSPSACQQSAHVPLGGGSKRKRSWSRAVFSNLQRKGLEIQFQQQKYITKPDRRKLAARLNLTDAQVKVWFQNRRMKWRHTRENLKSGQEKQVVAVDKKEPSAVSADKLEYSSDSMSSLCMSDNDDENEIDVVE